ncbi:MAG: MFS transporter [Candidatus Planktophila sp.]|nr:MFS transporter [Candidatus Planktophila sp.]
MFSAYSTVARSPGAMKFSLFGLIGRMPISMDPLALIFIVVAASNSYALAGALSATAAITMSIAMPYWSGVADRFGQRALLMRVFPLKLIGIGIFIALVQNDAPKWSWFASIIVAEASSINLGGLVRRRWLYVLGADTSSKSHNERDIVNAAYSLEALNDEFVFIVGPIIATACATSIDPSAGLLAGLVFLSIGMPVFANLRATEPPPSPRIGTIRPPAAMRSKALQAVVIPIMFVGGFFGAIAIVTVAFTAELGRSSTSGILLAIWACGSAVAALINGLVKWRLSHAARFLIFLISLTLLAIPLLFAHSILALALALFFNGVAVAPLIINAYGVAESSLPPDQITQSLSWVVAGMPLGGALASTVSGWSIDRFGAQISFWVPLGFLIASLVATLPYFTTYKALISYSSKHD